MHYDEKQQILGVIKNLKYLQNLLNLKWEGMSNYKHINYKKKRLSSIWSVKSTSEDEFFIRVADYLDFLQNNLSEIRKYSSGFITVRSRVKQKYSALNKLQKYITAKENGEVAISKCLNDLLGFRCIVNSDNKYMNIFDELTDILTNDKQVRVVKSFHGDYNAIHIYIQESNYTFPWELQLWKECDETKNETSHLTYKQEYVDNGDIY